jgi:hypothetical protein
VNIKKNMRKLRPGEGRPTYKKTGDKKDGSHWNVIIGWSDASRWFPVYGRLVLIADREGFVNILDLRLPEGEEWSHDKDDEYHSRTREALKRHKAKWWAYLPNSPPLNVKAMPGKFDEEENYVMPEANDPPDEELKIFWDDTPHNVLK